VIEIVAYGVPASQGSKRHVGKGIMIESSKATRPWRERVHFAALEAMAGAPRLEGPVALDVQFFFDRPKSHYGTGRNAGALKSDAPSVPATRATKDADKLLRACFDAMTSAGVYKDDSQVWLVVASKWWTERFARLETPGVVILVEEMTA
jgi:Holliday junction resolvase RusA-like endonuclease